MDDWIDTDSDDEYRLDVGDFEWDEVKAATNLDKHGVSFDEAREAIEHAQYISEPYRMRGESRMVILGPSSMGRMLEVVITMRGQNVRIISARRYRP